MSRARRLTIEVVGDAESVRRSLGQVGDDLDAAGRASQRFGDRLQAQGRRISDFGDQWSRRVTAPILGFGVASGKVAADFDSSMSKIVGLVGLTREEVDSMRDSVLALSGETAKSPQELADALFVITSAGLRGDAALEALTYSARASAAGLGETADIARAAAGVLNAYGPDVMSAADATDILAATARAGNFETSQLAGALGRVLPFAKQAGASFDDVGGAVALLTRTNGDAAQSITQVQALMRSFVVPTAEATKILGELGMSAADVRESIGTRGLARTLQDLDERLDGNREQLGRLLGSSEASSAAFQILDADARTLEETFGATANAAGMTNEAFQVAAETASFKISQAWMKIQIAAVGVGEAVLPVATTVAGAVGTMADAWGSLPGPMQNTVLGLAGVAAAAGPVMSIGGRLLTWAGGFANSLDAVRLRGMYAADSMRNLATRLGPMGIAGVAGVAAVGVGLLVNHIQQSRQRAEEARQRVSAYADAIRDAGDAAEGTARNLDRVIQENDRIRESLVRSGSTVDEMTEAIHGSDEAWDEWVASQVAAADAAGENMFAIGALEAALRREREAAREGASATAEYEQVASTTGDTAVDTASDIDTMTTAVDHQAERITMLSQAINDLLSETFGIDEAQRRWEDNIDSLTDHVAEHGTTLDVTTSAGRRNAEQIQRQVEAGARWLQTLAEQNASESELAAAQATLQAALGDTLAQLGFNEDEARRYIDALGDVPVELVTEVRVVTAQAMADLNALNQRLAEVNGARLAGGVGGAANRMHTGGIFRPSGGGREGWAWLEDGEGVFTRDQMRALGAAAGVDGGSTREGAQRGQMVFNGPVTFGSERAAADVDFWWQTKGAGV